MTTLWVVMSFCTSSIAKGSLTISLEHFVGARPLAFDSVYYTNAKGQKYTVTKFKYYIGKLKLKKADGTYVAVGAPYYLVDEEEPTSKNLNVDQVPAGAYSGCEFLIGVDSADNCSGAQSGALDPVNAMFWAWNTGYIFLKLEGKSPLSKSPGNMFEFHIGGYLPPNNCIRPVLVNFKNELVIKESHQSNLSLQVDAGRVMDGANPVDLSILSSVTDFHHAISIADNYCYMFSTKQ